VLPSVIDCENKLDIQNNTNITHCKHTELGIFVLELFCVAAQTHSWKLVSKCEIAVRWSNLGLRYLDSKIVLTIPNKILLYKLLLRSVITYAAPVWCSTSLTNYRHLQVYQSKCLRVIGDFPRRTPISNLHTYLQMIPIRQFTYNLTDKFFVSCPAHSNPLIRNTGNYTLENLHRQYPKYRHKRTKHILF